MMSKSGLLCLLAASSIIQVIASDAIPEAPASAPALPSIPGLSSIVDDLIRVVEKAKTRWDALQNSAGGLSLTNLLFPNRKRGPSRTDMFNNLVGGQKLPFQALMDSQSLNSFLYPLPYQFGNEEQIKRNSQLTSPSEPLFIPKNAAPSMKLIHRPVTPVNNWLYEMVPQQQQQFN